MSAFNPYRRAKRAKADRTPARLRKIEKQAFEARRKTYPAAQTGLHSSIVSVMHRAAKANARRLIKRMKSEGQQPVYTPKDPEVRVAFLRDQSVPALRERAKARGIKGYSKMNKAALLEALR